MRLLYSLLLWGCTSSCFAQLSDDFSDGNFRLQPVWVGDDSLFTVNASGQLQLNASSAKEASLATALESPPEEWRCWIRFAFSPSTSNYCRFYLNSSQPDLKSTTIAYYIQFGGSTGNRDSIMLWKQIGTVRTLLIGGRPSTVAKTNNQVNIRVVRKDEEWILYADTSGKTNWIEEGRATDNSAIAFSFTGFWAKVTSGNSRNCFIDDVYAGPLMEDTRPPQVRFAKLIPPYTVRIEYDEPIHPISAEDPYLYELTPIGHPSSVLIENNTITLTYLQPIVPAKHYTLHVQGIQDALGNTSNQWDTVLVWYRATATPGEVLISEWLPDPTPAVLLPESEFIELYNHSNQPIRLANWTLSDGSTQAILPDYLLSPGAFVICCPASFASEWQKWGPTIPLSTWPSLNNGGDHIVLKDAAQQTIDSLLFSSDWYASGEHAAGGYPLNLVYPNQRCNRIQAYTSSEGSPGKPDPKMNMSFDTLPPYIVIGKCVHKDSLLIEWNEAIASTALQQLSWNSNYIQELLYDTARSGNNHSYFHIQPSLQNRDSVQLILKNVSDCSGNHDTTKISLYYEVSDTAVVHDIVINEIMNDPDPTIGLPDAEYIELYNRSDRHINLENWMLKIGNNDCKLPAYWLRPHAYVVLLDPGAFALTNQLGVRGFPALPNSEGIIALYNTNGSNIHHVAYTTNWHANALNKQGGVSLELIDPMDPCTGESNWTSSKALAGGTPGEQNTVMGNLPDATPPYVVSVYPLSAAALEIRWNEPLDTTDLPSIETAGLHLQLLHATDDSHTAFIYEISPALQNGITYTLHISNATDCIGNKTTTQSLVFGLPKKPVSGDWKINELLFNPPVDGVDYIELINASSSILDVKDLVILSGLPEPDERVYFNKGDLVLPNEIVVCTSNPNWVKQYYHADTTARFLMIELPSFNDEAGYCRISDTYLNAIDEVQYDDQMHAPFMDDVSGVSLERISVNRPAADRTNWTSASFTSGFGTPGRPNSQSQQLSSATKRMNLEPKVFSPDGDGYHDVLNLSYALDESGFIGTITIYNSSGNLVNTLLQNSVLGTSGIVSWDGRTRQYETAQVGIYIILFEAFNTSGTVITEKHTVVLARQL